MPDLCTADVNGDSYYTDPGVNFVLVSFFYPSHYEMQCNSNLL